MGFMDYMPQFGQNVDQQPLPQDDTLMQLDLKRKLALADALRNQEAPQGQMVSGHYVAPSWTQQLDRMYGQYQGKQAENKALQGYGDYQTSKAQKYADLLGEQDPAKFQQSLAQMQEFAPELVKSRLASMVKDKTPIKGSAGDVFFDPTTHQQIFAVPNKPEKPTAPVVRNMRVGNQDVTQQWDADKGTWTEVARGNAFKPGGDGENKPPAGYTWSQQGGLVAIPGGPADKAVNPTEAQSNANLFGTRANKANQTLGQLEGKYSPAKIQVQNFTGGVPGASWLANKAMSDTDQKAAQAQMDFVTAILRKESGASISQSEFDNARRQYFPQPGDSPAVMKQKADNRATAIQAIQEASGPMNKPKGKVVVDY